MANEFDNPRQIRVVATSEDFGGQGTKAGELEQAKFETFSEELYQESTQLMSDIRGIIEELKTRGHDFEADVLTNGGLTPIIQISKPIFITDDDEKDFKECKKREYFGGYDLGSWWAEIKKQSEDSCFYKITLDVEQGWNEFFCKVSVGQSKIFELDPRWSIPNLDSLPQGCLEVARGNPHAYSVFLSPRLQEKTGIEPLDVLCSQGLSLIQKISNNSPACVKPETAEKLIERGWASV